MFGIPVEVLIMQVIFGLALGAIYVLLASGLSIIFGLLDVINFAHGTFYMLGAYAAFMATSLSGSFWVGVAASVVIVMLIGAMTEYFLLKPLYGEWPFYPLLLTFGFAVAVPDLMKALFGLIGKVVEYPEGLVGAFIWGGVLVPKYRLFIIIFTAVVMIALFLFLKRSDLGMIIRAATRDSLMVNVLGVNTSRIWTTGFALGVGLAALGGALHAPMVSAIPDMGVEMTVESFVVVVIGGLGSVGGAILGGLIIGQVVSFVSLFAGEYSQVAIFFAMAVILMVRPRGLFGEAGRL